QENAVWHEKHGVTVNEDKDIQTSVIDGLLCCLRSRCIGVVCVILPTVIFLLIYLFTSSSNVTDKRAMLIMTILIPSLYILLGCCLVCLVCCRQINADVENAHAAHRYLQIHANITKIAVTSGEHQTTAIAGRFPLFIQAAKEGHVENFQWCLDTGQLVDEIVAILLRNGVSIDLADKLDALTPLHYAAFYGHIKITRMLVAAGADMLLQDSRKMNPLQLAEMASLKMSSVQPSHQMIIKFLRVSMKDKVTPPLEHIAGLTVMNLVERQTFGLPQMD
ncbi:TPA: hypothetical protein N0F65_007154, partial [Lagenidium giganteum]